MERIHLCNIYAEVDIPGHLNNLTRGSLHYWDETHYSPSSGTHDVGFSVMADDVLYYMLDSNFTGLVPVELRTLEFSGLNTRAHK